MLYLTRKIGESIIINDEIRLTVIGITGRVVKLGFIYPEHAKVLREEIYERIQRENELAMTGSEEIKETLEDDDFDDYRFAINE